MRRFHLQRDEDESGISGVGIVAEGIVFWDGHAALRWRSDKTSTALYSSATDLEAIHGHGGKTRIVWIDEPPEELTQE